METYKIKVAIVDDHPLAIYGLKFILNNREDITVVGTYSDATRLFDGLNVETPHILLLDIKLPGLQGDDIAKIISDRYPAIKIIAVSYLDSVYYIQTMIRNGAAGYLTKTCDEHTLLEAIKHVHQGEQFIEQALKNRIMSASLLNRKEAEKEIRLTKREKEVLQLLASNHNSQNIADILFLSRRTVENHRFSLLTKLDVKNSATLVKKAIELNLL